MPLPSHLPRNACKLSGVWRRIAFLHPLTALPIGCCNFLAPATPHARMPLQGWLSGSVGGHDCLLSL
jgi:hypothetical protein